MKYLIYMMLFFLTACNLNQKGEPTLEPNAVYTSAAQTVAVQLTENAAKLPSVTSTQTLTWTPAPSSTQKETTLAVTASPKPSSTITMSSVADKVEFLNQTPADGTLVSIKEPFKVTWEVKNVGQTTWTTSYKVRFFSGSRIGAGLPNEVAFSKDVPPGDTIQITVDFLASTDQGAFQSNWVMTNQQGQNFYPLYITVNIASPSQTPTYTETIPPPQTMTPTQE